MASGCLSCSFDIVECLKLLREEGLCYWISPAKHERTLRREMKNLKDMRVAIEERADREEASHPRTTRKPEVVSWMGSVDSLDADVSGLLKSLAIRKSCLSFWRCSCKSDNELGKRVEEALDQIKGLTERHNSLGETLVHIDPESNIGILKREMSTLTAIKKDLIKEVRLQEVQQIGTKSTYLVKNWIKEVESVEHQVHELIGDTLPPKQRSQASSSNQQSHANNDQQFCRNVVRLLEDVRKLTRGRGDLGDLVNHELPDAVEPVEIFSTSMVGRETVITEIKSRLLDDKIGIIGLYGMGGVGKTTMLQNLNNKCLASDVMGFDLVIWVTVSKELSPLNIRKTISERLGMKIEEGTSAPSASDIRKALSSKKRFLLILDDLWEKVHLPDLGVPLPDTDKRCKVVLTTRDEKVCRDMKAETIKVELLNGPESSILFEGNLGNKVNVSDPILGPLIREVIRKCHGLPLVLTVLARAMADATTSEEWELAITTLRACPTDIEGMEEEVFEILKFSYDKLKDDSTKACFLSCSWFPEDHEIPIEELINIWFGEGLLNHPKRLVRIHEARGCGHKIINCLKRVCLLDDGKPGTVKLHDVIREMAIRLVGTKKQLWTDEPSQVYREKSISDEVERMFLVGWVSEAETVSSKFPDFPNLKTLVIEGLGIGKPICLGTMPNLRVLHLTLVPLSMQSLESISELSELRSLSLEGSGIESLPMEFGQLTKLKLLNLSDTWALEEIPKEAFSKVVNLESLDMSGSYFRWNEGRNKGNASLGDLEGLEQLVELGVDIVGPEEFETYSRSKKLMQSTSSLCVMFNDTIETPPDDFFCMTRLTKLRVGELGKLQNMVCSHTIQLAYLKELILENMQVLRSISDQTLLLPSLEYLRVKDCPQLEKLPLGTQSTPRLRVLYISNMQGLRSISDQTLLFPSLEYLLVYDCPQLKKLPLGPQSASKLETIRCDKEWFEGLEWEDQALKSKLQHLIG